MKKHLSMKLLIAVIALSVYSFMVIKNGRVPSHQDQATFASESPRATQNAVAQPQLDAPASAVPALGN